MLNPRNKMEKERKRRLTWELGSMLAWLLAHVLDAGTLECLLIFVLATLLL